MPKRGGPLRKTIVMNRSVDDRFAAAILMGCMPAFGLFKD
jgi:hypothetical protein